MKKAALLLLLIFILPLKTHAKESTVAVQFTDKAGRPITGMRTEAFLDDTTLSFVTDEEGRIYIPVDKDFPFEFRVTTRFEHRFNDMPFYVIGILNDEGVMVHLKNDFDIAVKSPSDLWQTFKIQSEDEGNRKYNDQLVTVYQYLKDAVFFYREILNVYEEFDIPTVYVVCYGSLDNTYYFDDIFVISETDMSVNNENAPQNREWHEYSHHILFNLHKKWPQTQGGFEKNHAGFLNDSTADSYVEGFAEFMSLMIGEYNGYAFKDVYNPIGSMEIDFLPVDYFGMGEEFAICGILWDLYDEINDDPVHMSMEEIWAVLKRFNNDFTDVYEGLTSMYPDRKNEINRVFVNHGFFINLKPGNGKWDFGEPYMGWPDRYRPFDYFIDLPRYKDRILFQYSPGEKIGSAGDLSRPKRRTAMAPLGHCIRTKDKTACYTIDVVFDDNEYSPYTMRVNNIKGDIKFAVPPDRYKATITVKPDRTECGKVLTIRSEDFYKKYQKSVKNRYYLEHRFEPLGREEDSKEDPYRYYPDPSGEEAVTDESGRPIVLFSEKDAPKGFLEEEGDGSLLSILLVLVILFLLLFKKPR
ncbi:MAG: hypothetical protein ACOX3Q_02375 [Clostridia bacterium]|jgi:hypothetical protein